MFKPRLWSPAFVRCHLNEATNVHTNNLYIDDGGRLVWDGPLEAVQQLILAHLYADKALA